MYEKKHVSVSLKKEINDRVRKVVKSYPNEFTTSSEFVRKAVEDKLGDFEKSIRIQGIEFGPNITEKTIYQMASTFIDAYSVSYPEFLIGELFLTLLAYEDIIDPKYEDFRALHDEAVRDPNKRSFKTHLLKDAQRNKKK